MSFRFTGLLKDSRLSHFWLILLISSSIFYLNVDGQEYFNDLEDSVYLPYWINVRPIESSSAHSGSFYSIADSVNPFGLGIESVFPEKYRNKNIILNVSGWVKSNVPKDQAQYVISLNEDGKQVLWQNINLSPYIEEKNHWYNFSDSVRVPASLTKHGKFKVYLWNNDLKDTIAIDDLKVFFSDISMPTYIPELITRETKNVSLKMNLLYSNLFYKIYYSPQDRTFQIFSVRDSLLIQNILFYSGRVRKGENIINQKGLMFKSVRNKGNSKVLRFTANSKLSRVLIEFICLDNSPEIKIDVLEHFKYGQSVNRESLVLSNQQNINEVYRANRKSDINDFQIEYWLDKQGVKFGSGKESFIIYHTPEISSLQLQKDKKLLWVNLDYKKDHPFLHFPLKNDTMDYFQDWSENIYKRADRNKFSFSIFVGATTGSLPRIMKNPYGFLATYIWTEHADFTNIRTNRATYFGNEKISNADSAQGGFFGYKIPVTKSVFYANPDSVTNTTVSNHLFNEFESSIKSDSNYFDFLIQLRNRGYEICLHSPDNFTTNRNLLKESLSFMKKEFHSKSWIDHGYNNGIKNNREDLVCDGTLKNSPYYAMDLWENAGLKYFWDPYYEDNLTFENWKFSQFIDVPFHGFGDRFPNPDYWKNQTRAGDLIQWPTKSVMYFPDDNFWDFYFNDQTLSWFIKTWGVEINHCYPAWVDPEKGFWIYGNDSSIIAAPGFNRTLQRMAALRDKKLLNVITVEQYLDYQVGLQDLCYQILPDGRVKVTNNNQKTINGLSFATRAQEVVVNGLRPVHKEEGNDLIFWFDLKPRETKIIRVIN